MRRWSTSTRTFGLGPLFALAGWFGACGGGSHPGSAGGTAGSGATGTGAAATGGAADQVPTGGRGGTGGTGGGQTGTGGTATGGTAGGGVDGGEDASGTAEAARERDARADTRGPDADAGTGGSGGSDGSGAGTGCPVAEAACSKRNGLVASYLFEEPSAGTSSVERGDSTACGHHLGDPKFVASTSTAHGGLLAARNVGAGDDYLSRADSPSLSVFHAGRSFTVAAWFQILAEPTDGGKALIMKGTKVGASPVREFGVEHQPAGSACGGAQAGTNHLHAAVFDNARSGAPGVTIDIPNTRVDPNGFDPSASVGKWQFVIVWHDDAARRLSIQVNGGMVYSISTSSIVIRDTSAPLVIGGKDFAGAKNWDGIYDDIAIWSRMLTAAERVGVLVGGVSCP